MKFLLILLQVLESLQRRRRGRRAGRILTGLGIAKAAPAPAPSNTPATNSGSALPDRGDAFKLVLQRRELDCEAPPYGRVTESLYALLDDEEVSEIESRLDADDARLWRSTPVEHRRSLALAFGVHYGVPGVTEKTGLSSAMPPPNVHAMSHYSTDAGGAYYYADLVDEALRGVGFEIRPGMKGLDFGSSSGRVVRLLSLAFPQIEWHACDPNPGAIGWASANLPGIRFFTNDIQPPLPLAAESLDVVVAISIWSHFSERAALEWFTEMERVIRPGGILVFTVQGWHGLQVFAEGQLWAPEDIERTVSDLYTRGFSFIDAFGPQGDHGVANPDWGMSHTTPEWLAAQLCPAWSILDFKPGRVERHQDLVVLQRRRDIVRGR
jgi:SAM-dependent methyltransferase